jgi:hypothetical protein
LLLNPEVVMSTARHAFSRSRRRRAVTQWVTCQGRTCYARPRGAHRSFNFATWRYALPEPPVVYQGFCAGNGAGTEGDVHASVLLASEISSGTELTSESQIWI